MSSTERNRSRSASQPNKNVFINCPFDEQYLTLFRAAVFSVLDCGFVPRCALEAANGAEVRIEKIFKLIADCQFGIHDLSRTELDAAHGLPRFNMPFELGVFLGAKKFGGAPHRSKECLIIDKDKYRYQKFLSDISGQDIAEHEADARTYIGKIRDWLDTCSVNQSAPLPGGLYIAERFDEFIVDLPQIARSFHLESDTLSFPNYAHCASWWLRQALARSP